jgi:hypothetical protein
MPDPNIEQVYSKTPDQQSLEADLLEQGLAEEGAEGGVQPKISITTWQPLKSVTKDADGNVTGRTYADYLLVLTGWTENSMRQAGLTQEGVQALLDAGTLPNGTEIGVDVSALDLHNSEPQLKTYGA